MSITSKITEVLDYLTSKFYLRAVGSGFWQTSQWEPDPEKMTIEQIFELVTKAQLIEGEIAEFVDALRDTTMQPDKHLPHRKNYQVELIDVLIRTLDLCGRLEIPVGEIMMEKMEANTKRGKRHGRRF